MIDLEVLAGEARDYSFSMYDTFQESWELFRDIMDKLYELEAEDDRNGTNELEELLERHDIEWFAKEYGLI